MDNRVEERRNRLLRRADWRYLLANPWPERSVCLSDGFISQAVQAVSSQCVPVDEGMSGGCDLAVASNPSRSDLQKAWQALQPGGEIYCEWYSPLAGGPSGIRKRMEAAGFTQVECYWPWPIPNISPTLFWLPLEAPDTLGYFLSNRQRSANLLARIGRNVALFSWKLLRKAGLLVPICVTAQKRGSRLEAPLSIVPKDHPASNAGGFDKLMWTGGRRSINKIVLYMFAPGEKVPQQVVKLPRTTETSLSLTREAHILQALWARKTGPASRAPQVLFMSETKGMLALGETAVSGQPMYTVLNKGNAHSLAVKVTEWLASLATGEPLCPREVWWDRLVETALHGFEQDFKPVMDEAILSKCRAILEQLPDLPQVFEHRDCSPWNLLITADDKLAVLDWESAEEYGLPALDLTYFLAYLVFFLDGAMKKQNFIDSYRHLSDEMTFSGGLWATCQQLYIERTGLDPAALHPLRLLTWMIHARSEARRLAEDAGGTAQPSALRRSLFYNLALEELRKDTI